MRGYFAIGIEGASKAGNIGNLMRTAHGFGAAFVFAIAPALKSAERRNLRARTDTSKTETQIPYYEFDSLAGLKLPKGCALVGVELIDDAQEMPAFRHPLNAAYILGSERYSLSDGVIAACDHVIKIPTKFCLNVATAGAVVMYDRLLCHGRFPDRPVSPRGRPEPLPAHVRGAPIERKREKEKEEGS